jgi:hypothetical protein
MTILSELAIASLAVVTFGPVIMHLWCAKMG